MGLALIVLGDGKPITARESQWAGLSAVMQNHITTALVLPLEAPFMPLPVPWYLSGTGSTGED